MTGINLYDPSSPDRYAFAIAFGGMIIHAGLLADRLGMYERIRKSLRIVEDIVGVASNRIFEKGTNPLDVYSEAEIEWFRAHLNSIWAGTDFRGILNRSIRDSSLTLKA